MYVLRPLLLGLPLVFAVLAGCAAEGTAGVQSVAVDADAICLEGTVVDEELIPVVAAEIAIKDVLGTLSTDDLGRFALCPVEAGDYQITVSKRGYASATQSVSVAYETVRITLTLKAIALDVPYHTAQHHVTFVICASFNPIGGVPCTKLVDYLAGTNVSSSERFAFTFRVSNPNLADMLVEMVWSSQQFGKDMLFMIQTPPGQPATALSTKYFAMEGGAPLRGWVTAGIKNRCGGGECAGVFDAEPGKVTYEGMTAWSDGNSTVPGVPGYLSGTTLYLNHRTETWMTEFYNRAGSRDYTALPDS